MGYWAGILVLAMIHKLWTVVLETLESRKLHKDLEGGSNASTSLFNTSRFGAVGHAWHTLRTWIIIPAGLAPFVHKHQRLVAGWGIMPRRLDMLIVVGYWIVVIVLCCVGYDTFEGNLKFPILEMNNLDFIGNRTGYMAEMGLVFIWVFSGRNNIFLWVTNFSFRSFNIFHRQSAIAATVMIVVHTATYVRFEVKYSTFFFFFLFMFLVQSPVCTLTAARGEDERADPRDIHYHGRYGWSGHVPSLPYGTPLGPPQVVRAVPDCTHCHGYPGHLRRVVVSCPWALRLYR